MTKIDKTDVRNEESNYITKCLGSWTVGYVNSDVDTILDLISIFRTHLTENYNSAFNEMDRLL